MSRFTSLRSAQVRDYDGIVVAVLSAVRIHSDQGNMTVKPFNPNDALAMAVLSCYVGGNLEKLASGGDMRGKVRGMNMKMNMGMNAKDIMDNTVDVSMGPNGNGRGGGGETARRD